MRSSFELVRVALLAAAVCVACKGSGPSAVGDTNTNWLRLCDEDRECGELFSCMCGRCTIECTEDLDCDARGSGAVCQAPSAACGAPGASCQPVDPSDTRDGGGLAVGLPEIGGFSASETELPGGGGDAELSWDVSGADTLTLLTDGDSGSEPVSGSGTTVAVTQTTTYTLVATNGVGSVRSDVRVEVSARGLLDWTSRIDAPTSQASDATMDAEGDVYVVGRSDGPGGSDGFVSRYSGASGDLSWREVLSTDSSDVARGVAIDPSGDVLVVGLTSGALHGVDAGNGDRGDGFLVRYSPSGERLWTRLIGTAEHDAANAVAVDASGNIVVVGEWGRGADTPPRAFLAKYTAGGDQVWLRELGTGAGLTVAEGVVVDDGAVTVAGRTEEALGDTPIGRADALVAHYTAEGELAWAQQGGSVADDAAHAVALGPDGDLFVVGESQGWAGASTAGAADVFVARCSPSSGFTGVHPFGSSTQDIAFDVAVDTSGNVYVVGMTDGTLGAANLGTYDVFVTKLSAGFERDWTQQFGSAAQDFGYGVAADLHGNVYVVGSTLGDFGGAAPTDDAGFVVRIR